jgi:hypothetical protein
MAGLDLVKVQEDIYDHVVSSFPGYKVYQDFILNEQQLEKMEARVKPFIVISWDSLRRSARNASFAGVRHDEYYSGFSIGVIAPTPTQCRKAMNYITDALIGWSPDGVGKLVPTGGLGSFVVSERSGVPHLYMSMSSFVFPMNAIDPGSNIVPNSGS